MGIEFLVVFIWSFVAQGLDTLFEDEVLRVSVSFQVLLESISLLTDFLDELNGFGFHITVDKLELLLEGNHTLLESRLE